MRSIIRRHNRLNGVIFSVLEFGLIALVIGAFATYYLLHHEAILAVIAWGITLNCVPVVLDGVHVLLEDNAIDNRIGTIWDKHARAQHQQENPHMLRDTLVLTVATLVPWVTLTIVLYELWTTRMAHKA